ncbi:hypothetical protein ACOJIV_25635 [Haloarcula sp. AONF1]
MTVREKRRDGTRANRSGQIRCVRALRRPSPLRSSRSGAAKARRFLAVGMDGVGEADVSIDRHGAQ